MNFKTFAVASAMVVGLASTALATPVTFSSSGAFSNLSSGSGASINPSNVLNMSASSSGSTLTANAVGPTSFSVPPTVSNVLLGSLTWVNKGTFSNDFTVKYALTVNFTAPNADTASRTFDLDVEQRSSSNPDQIAGFASLGNLANDFNLNGVSVSNIHWALVSGTGTYNNSDTNNGKTGVWELLGCSSSSSSSFSTFSSSSHSGGGGCTSTTSTLGLYADFSSTGTNPNPIELPEPASMALLGMGLLGLGAMRRRKAA